MNLSRIFFFSATSAFLLLGLSACGANQNVSTNQGQVIVPSSAKPVQSGDSPNKSSSSKTEQKTATESTHRSFFTNMDMIDSQTGFVSGYDKGMFYIWKTTDGGSHWKLYNVPDVPEFSNFRTDAPLPPAVYFRSEKEGWTAWVAHEKKRNTLTVLNTTDGGKVWTKHVQMVLPVANSAVQIYFSSSHDGWIRLFSGGAMNQGDTSIYHTTDGGKSWSLVSSADGYIPNKNATPHALPTVDTPMPMVFTDAKNGWIAVGSPIITGIASLYLTTTAGNDWYPVSLTVPKAFKNGYNTMVYQPIFSGKAGTVVVQYQGASEKAIGYHTTNSGKTWTAGASVSLGKEDYSIAQSFINPDIGWMIGRSGDSLLRTENGGKSWSIIPISDSLKPYLSQKYTVSQLDMVSSRTGWIVLDRNDLTPAKIFKTIDGGKSWALQTLVN